MITLKQIQAFSEVLLAEEEMRVSMAQRSPNTLKVRSERTQKTNQKNVNLFESLIIDRSLLVSSHNTSCLEFRGTNSLICPYDSLGVTLGGLINPMG